MNLFDFEKAWAIVHEHIQQGLPESALTALNDIDVQARAQQDTGQQIKVLIHRFKLVDEKEENAFVQNMTKLREAAAQATYPAKPLLHSMLGELYWQYYQHNRYAFINRSMVTEGGSEDIDTWSLPQLVQETTLQYTLSLQEAEQGKKDPLSLYAPVIIWGNEKGQDTRPTLFDFLAHRAIDHFMSDEAGVVKPANGFTLNDAAYLSDAVTFAALTLTSEDTLSMKFHALRLLQELTRLHLYDADPAALVDVDLKRLQFVRSHLTLPYKEALYLEALEQLSHKVAGHPAACLVTLAIAYVWVGRASEYKPLVSDAHKWELKTAWDLCEQAKQPFPDSEGAIRCENLQEDLQRKYIRAAIEANNLPGQPFRCLVHYKNITALHYRIFKTNRKDMRALQHRLKDDYYDRDRLMLEHFTAMKPVATGYYTLPDDGDMQQHSIELKLDALPVGEYLVLYSHHPEFTSHNNALAYAFTAVTHISYVHRNLPSGDTELYTLHRQTGEALEGVDINIFSWRYSRKHSEYERVLVGSVTSDVQGYCKVDYFRSDDYRNFTIECCKGDDFFSTEALDTNGYSYYSGAINQYKSSPEPITTRTFFFLDRGIYRPGQTIYFKGLVIDTNGKSPRIKTGYPTTISLYDVNGQQQGQLELTTNEYGTFHGAFTAPTGGLTGNMTIRTQDYTGSTSFSVEEYKRPKFEAGFEVVKDSFRLHDQITTTGYARAYSGAPIDGAQVKYRVVRAASFPSWYWYRWGNYPTSPQQEILHGATTTDAAGKFTVTFEAIPDLSIDRSSDPTFSYMVYADVTDINGETHSSSTSVSVAYRSLLINASIGNINTDEDTLPTGFAVYTTNLAGAFQPAKGILTIAQLQSPAKAFRERLWEQPDKHLYSQKDYYTLFPHDLYADENNRYTWPAATTVLHAPFDTANSNRIPATDIHQWQAGQYRWELSSTDKDGQPVREMGYFTIYAPSAPTLATPAIHYFQPLKTTVEPDDKALFVTGTTEPSIHVLYETEQDGVILDREWITLHQEQRTFAVPIKAAYRGNIAVHYTFIVNNRLYTQEIDITVPFTNKQLDISFASFRDKLQPGAQEEWKILVRGKAADKVAAEMVATLYDASLDVFRANNWYASFYSSRYAQLSWNSTHGFDRRDLKLYTPDWNKEHSRYDHGAIYNTLNWFDYHFNDYEHALPGGPSGGRMAGRGERYRMSESAAAAPMMSRKRSVSKEMAEEESVSLDAASEPTPVTKPDVASGTAGDTDLSAVKVRTNFNETAFFYPDLRTNEHGEIIIRFTIPEALTRWKMLGFAHTQDLQSGSAWNQLVTQKDIMVVPNQPRFFRENDHMQFSAKITSMVDAPLSGDARLEFFDALTGRNIDGLMKNITTTQSFTVPARQSTQLAWSIEIPEGLQAITYRIVASTGDFSDGEEMVLPVVTNRMLVTESLPLPIRGKETRTFSFEKLLNSASSGTLRHQRYTLEFTSNPAWYAVQSLPYLMEYPYDCVEQLFSKYYANSIATHIANSHPRIKQVFDTWKNIQPDALLSNLEKNQELKSALLEETPWVLQAKDESQRKRAVGLLFDLNRMAREQEQALTKVAKAQNGDGGFSWFNGFPSDRYMTQHIIAGMGHLMVLGVKNIDTDERSKDMVQNGIRYMDERIRRDYEELKEQAKRQFIKLEDDHIGYLQYHYLYTRSCFTNTSIPEHCTEAFNYFIQQAAQYWLQTSLYMQGMACLALHRFDKKETTAAMIRSFSERALHSEEMGMYWKNARGYFWHQAPIETQALMIEVYDEVAGDARAVEDLKAWLLKQKQTTDWKTTKATVEACYALLRRGADALASNQLVSVTVGDEVIDPATRPDASIEAGTGYFKTAWQAGDIKPGMGAITVSKADEGIAWGAVYWQYFEQLDKITPAETGVQLKKELFLQQHTDRGPVINIVNDQTSLQVGDLVKVRIELRVDRNLEYVHLKDMRAAAFEPVSTLSQHKYQDGLYYYESTRDLATNFFIGWLGKGTYVFEYALRVSQKGDFSNGITTIQCMYAPEFTSHSAGIRVQVK